MRRGPPRRRKAASLKRRNAPKATRNRGASIAGQETVVARLTHERDEALLREAANSEILRLISRSPGDLELVFRSILENATRICNANFGTLFRFDGENFYPVAQSNTPTALLEAQTRRGPFKPRPGTPIDRVMRTRQVIHSADDAAEPVPGLAAKLIGARSLVAVPISCSKLVRIDRIGARLCGWWSGASGTYRSSRARTSGVTRIGLHRVCAKGRLALAASTVVPHSAWCAAGTSTLPFLVVCKSMNEGGWLTGPFLEK
jgi:hypothetical protein